jgi:hypothetical protein
MIAMSHASSYQPATIHSKLLIVVTVACAIAQLPA